MAWCGGRAGLLHLTANQASVKGHMGSNPIHTVSKTKRAVSSAGQSTRLINGRPWVRTPHGPSPVPVIPVMAIPAGQVFSLIIGFHYPCWLQVFFVHTPWRETRGYKNCCMAQTSLCIRRTYCVLQYVWLVIQAEGYITSICISVYTAKHNARCHVSNRNK